MLQGTRASVLRMGRGRKGLRPLQVLVEPNERSSGAGKACGFPEGGGDKGAGSAREPAQGRGFPVSTALREAFLAS